VRSFHAKCAWLSVAEEGANPTHVASTSRSAASSTAEILVWQSRLRVLVATTIAGAELLLLADAGVLASPAAGIVVLATISYILLSAASAAIGRRGDVPAWVVGAITCSDVALIFALTMAVSSPAYYHRILIIALFVLPLHTFYFGRRHGAAVLVLTAAGYATVMQVSIAAGVPLAWREEFWSLAVFLLAAGMLLVEQGNLRARLSSIVRLFGRAEEGDFSESYNEDVDTRADSITRVGRAYNRVRGQLANMVLTDPLTGCVNRRGFDQALTREVARANRANSELALVALDVDHFKSINDTLGHLAGDAVLREVGALLLHAARAGDVVARTGGDEFSLVLPDTSAGGAHQLATRLCDALRTHRFAGAARGVKLTVSIGVVAQSDALAPVSESVELVKGRADEALYVAKRAGRNRVHVWTAPAAAEPRVPALRR
jgi:diguanylate cyclase (GGDEF)-like protein